MDDSRDIDGLHVAAVSEHDGRTLNLGLRWRRGLIGFLLRQQALNIVVELGADAVDNVVGDDRAGEVMHEEKQCRDADEYESRTDGNREIGDGFALTVGTAQDQEQVNDGRCEQAQ